MVLLPFHYQQEVVHQKYLQGLAQLGILPKEHSYHNNFHGGLWPIFIYNIHRQFSSMHREKCTWYKLQISILELRKQPSISLFLFQMPTYKIPLMTHHNHLDFSCQYSLLSKLFHSDWVLYIRYIPSNNTHRIFLLRI